MREAEIKEAQKRFEETVSRLEAMEHESQQTLSAKINDIDSMYDIRLRELETQFRLEKQKLSAEKKQKIQQERRHQEQILRSRASLEF